MENPPPVHRRDNDLQDGSTVHRKSDFGEASVGSTASLKSSAPNHDPGSTDDAVTVIRKLDTDSAGVRSPGSLSVTPASVAGVLLGTHLNHFLLEELIGGGGMGAVFRARDERLERIVAIKVIPFVGDDVDLQRRFRNEAQNAARLDHPYIARVFDVGQFEQWHYIVFEHVEGINLRDMIARDGVLSIDDAVYYTRQIAEAIEHANGRGIVHRDIKPSNVLVSSDGNVKVVDMGLARSQQIEVSGDMTASGVTLGTFDYISPEQARDPRDADVRSDIYSLGCTLYYLLTAMPPYPGGTMLQKLLSHGNAPPPDPRGLRPEVSDNLTAIIHKMLAKDPGDRYPRAIDVVADLRELAVREGLTRAQSRGTLTVTPLDPIPGFLIRHLPWMIAAALVIGIAGWLQLASSVSRDAFNLPLDQSAVIVRPGNAVGQAIAARSPANAAAVGDRNADVIMTTKPIDAAAANAASRDRLSPLPTDPVVTTGEPPQTVDATNMPGSKTTSGIDVATVPPVFADVAFQSSAIKLPNRGIVPTTLTKVTRIIVGESSDLPETPDAAYVRYTPTLEEAFRLATQLQVNEIDLAEPVVMSTPIVVARDGLIVRSLVGKTEIRFIDGEKLSMQRLAMLDIGNHRLELQNVHLSWNARNVGIEGGAMFRLASRNRLLRLLDCTLTIENVANRDDVYAFEIRDVEGQLKSPPSSSLPATKLSPPLDDTVQKTPEKIPPLSDSVTRTEKSTSPPLVAIELQNVAARGEITLIQLADPVQLQFQWRNGLLAVSRRFLDGCGTNAPPQLANNQIQLSFEQVTIFAPQGLARMALGPSGLNPIFIDRNSRKTVFHHAAAASHVGFEGLESNAIEPGTIVQLRGEDNAYDFAFSRDAILLTMDQWNGKARSLRLGDILSPEKSTWVTDRSPKWDVRWSQSLPPSTASRWVTDDFLQDGTIVTGFDKNLLPPFPAKPKAEPKI